VSIETETPAYFKRTSVHLPENVFQALRHRAYTEDRSMASLIRLAVLRYLTGDEAAYRESKYPHGKTDD